MTDPLVLVVAYGRPDLLTRCLGAVEGLPVAVVDNSRSDEVQAVVCAHGARYVRSPGNVGFGAGVNLGLALAWDGASDVLLLNPDAELSVTGVRDVQRRLTTDEGAGMASPRLTGPDGPQRASWPLPGPAQVWLDAAGFGTRSARKHFLTGAVLMIKAAALRDVGVFDERFFLYSEEADWERRALHRGWRGLVVDEVVAMHVSGGTGTSETTRSWSRSSGDLYLRKWSGRAGWACARVGAVLGAVRRLPQGPHIRAELRLLTTRQASTSS